MSSYKVPQDVEADDKLLGPFSFRQFIYLMIVAVAVGLGWLFFTIFPPLVILPLPFILFFGALALPLRKDQPMEIYMAAILSFYLKPRRRIWDPDGIETLVYIATPRNSEMQLTKNVTSLEAGQRLRYLADLSDTHGWSVRGVRNQSGSSMNADVYNEAQQTQDPLDTGGALAQNFDQMISQTDQRRHQETLNNFQTAAASPQPVAEPVISPPPTVTPPTNPDPNPPITIPSDPYANLYSTPVSVTPSPVNQDDITPSQTLPTNTVDQLSPFDVAPAPQFNPYPTSMNQAVVQPLLASTQVAPAQDYPTNQSPQPETTTADQTTTSINAVSPDIIKLASNADLSIETIAREAHRINNKVATSDDGDEVIISLR